MGVTKDAAQNVWDSEPAMILALLNAGIALVTSFGLQLTAEQTGAILTFSTLALGLWTRSKVASPRSVAAAIAAVGEKAQTASAQVEEVKAQAADLSTERP